MKKGFTLIELLAVITILAIILSISIPAVSKMIVKSRSSLGKTNIVAYVKAINKILISKETGFNVISDGNYLLNSDGNICSNSIVDSDIPEIYFSDISIVPVPACETPIDIKATGAKPNDGFIIIEAGKVIKAGLKLDNEYYNYYKDSVIVYNEQESQSVETIQDYISSLYTYLADNSINEGIYQLINNEKRDVCFDTLYPGEISDKYDGSVDLVGSCTNPSNLTENYGFNDGYVKINDANRVDKAGFTLDGKHYTYTYSEDNPTITILNESNSD